MFIALYIFYALAQAILIARYHIKEETAPVALVVIMTIFAPIVSALLLLGGFVEAVKWLVTYRPKDKQ